MNTFVIKNPIITEKATTMAANGTYLFLVRDTATKPEIEKAVRSMYKVEPTKVRIVNTKPKQKRLGSSLGIRPGYKKAMVTLKSGQKLDILPQ
jgi:large subunit ribosomal protein L23